MYVFNIVSPTLDSYLPGSIQGVRGEILGVTVLK